MRARDLDAVEAISRASLIHSRDDLVQWLTESRRPPQAPTQRTNDLEE
jgi:hypothetical protein